VPIPSYNNTNLTWLYTLLVQVDYTEILQNFEKLVSTKKKYQFLSEMELLYPIGKNVVLIGRKTYHISIKVLIPVRRFSVFRFQRKKI
jgi:dihydrofolate reductase